LYNLTQQGMFNFNLDVIILYTWGLKSTTHDRPNSKFRGNPGYLFQVVLSLGLGVRFFMINYTRITENTPLVKLPPKDMAAASPCYLYPAFYDVGMSSLRKATALRRLFCA
jgi:hypothetical protein